MKVIIKIDLVSKIEKVINVFYGENDVYINEWIKDYFNQEMCIMRVESMESMDKNVSDIDYYIETEDSLFYLIKKYKLLSRGYVYNKSGIICDKIQSIKIMDFDGMVNNVEISGSNLWNGINNEINHRVMRNIDHDSLFQLNIKLEDALKTKDTWRSTELVMLQNEVIKVHKKELYSSILKKVKKFNKKSVETPILSPLLLKCKTLMMEGGKMNGKMSGIPDLSRFSNCCSLEYQIINKKKMD